MELQDPTRTSGYTSSDPRQYRYWSPTQQFASSDQLARYLQEGWQLNGVVKVEKHWFGDARFIQIYRLNLQRRNETVTMAVMSNPFSRELLSNKQLKMMVVERKQPRPSIKFEVANK